MTRITTSIILFLALVFVPMAPTRATHTPELPDLTLFDVEVSGILFEGKELTFSGVVKNVGHVATEKNAITYFTVDGSALQSFSVLPLAAGESITHTRSWTASSGTHTLQLCTDQQNDIAESNEDNNCSNDLFFTVSSGTSTAPEGMIIKPNGGEMLKRGDSVFIDWTLFNYTGDVTLSLVQGFDDTFVRDIKTDLPASTRGYTWFVENDITPANNYKIAFKQSGGSVLDLSNSFFTITGLPAGPPLIRAEGGKRVYRVLEGKKMWVPSSAAFLAQGLKFENVVAQTRAEVDALPRLRFIRPKGGSAVYYITESGLKRWVRTAGVFNSYGNDWDDIVEVGSAIINSFADSTLVRLEGGSRVYKLEAAEKRWIKTAAAFNRRGYNWSIVAPVNQAELDSYRDGRDIE